MGNNPAVVHAFGNPQSRGHAETLFREFDKDKNGRLDQREYAAFLDAYWEYLTKLHPSLRNTDKKAHLAPLMCSNQSSVEFFEFWARIKAFSEGEPVQDDPTMRCHACTGISQVPQSVPDGAFLKCPFCENLNTFSKPSHQHSGASRPSPGVAAHNHVGNPSPHMSAHGSPPSSLPSSGSPMYQQASPRPIPLASPMVSPSPMASPRMASPMASPMSPMSPMTSPMAPMGLPVGARPMGVLMASPMNVPPGSHYSHPHLHAVPMGSPMAHQLHAHQMSPRAMPPYQAVGPHAVPPPQQQAHYFSPPGPAGQAFNSPLPSPAAQQAAPSSAPLRCLTPGCDSFGNAANSGLCNKCGNARRNQQQQPLQQQQQPYQEPPMYSPPIQISPSQNMSPQVMYSLESPQVAQDVSLATREQLAEEIFRLLDANGDESIHPREAGFLAELFEHINMRAAEGLLKELRAAEKFGDEEKKSLSRLEMLTKIHLLPEAAMRDIHQKLFALDAKFRTELLTALFHQWDSDHNRRMDEDEAQLFGVIAQTKIIELFKGRDPELANRLEARVGLFQKEVAKCRNIGGIGPERFIQFWMGWSLVHLYAVFHDVLPPEVFGQLAGNPFGSFARHQVEFALEHSKKMAFQSTGLYLLYEKGDGNCMFRSVARLLKGDPEAHFVAVRLEAAEHMQRESLLNPGEGYLADIWGFPSYNLFVQARLDRRRWERGCVGNKKDWGFDPDLQAISSLYKRPIHIYRQHSATVAAKRGPDTIVYPVGQDRRLFENTRPITLYYTGAHYQSLVHDPDFTQPMGPGPDALSAGQAAALEESMRQLQIQASLPEWTCDFCMRANPGSAEACGRCKIKPRR